jgi:hypothetical protein
MYYIETNNIFGTTSMGGDLQNVPQILIIAVTNSTPGSAGSTSASQLDTFLASITTLTGIPVTT